MRISVVLDCHDPKALVEFWSTAMGYRSAASLAQFEVLVPTDGEPPGPTLILQEVDEPKASKNRMHIDIHPALALGVPALVAQLEKLGGSRVGEPVTGLGVERKTIDEYTRLLEDLFLVQRLPAWGH